MGGAVTRAFVEVGYRIATTYTLWEKWENLGGLKDMVLDVPRSRTCLGFVG